MIQRYATKRPSHTLLSKSSSMLARASAPMSGLATRRPGSAAYGAYQLHGSGLPVQLKLTINQPGDQYEQEADRVADHVMRLPETAVQRQTCACGKSAGPDGMCEDCKRKQLAIQRKAGETGGQPTAPPIVHQTLRQPGRPLERSTQMQMSSRLGYDFGNVRIHTNDEAAKSAQAIKAQAYTVGQNIVFAAGKYAPGTSQGTKLLAHELTHVMQQQAAPSLRRTPDPAPENQDPPAPSDAAAKAAEKQAATLEKEILADPVYTKLAADSKARVQEIILLAKAKPLGNASGQRNYYLTKLKIAITTPFDGKESGKAEYGCSDVAEKKNREAVEKALEIEKRWWDIPEFASVEENAVATGNLKPRKGRGGKKFYVDGSDPKNVRVQIKVKLKGKPEEVASIRKLEDAIERESHTKGYYLDIVFVDTTGDDVFEFTVSFCQWANAGNWASGPISLSHEVHHALGLEDRYDYIEAHSANRQMNVPMRLVWFAKQMKKTGGPRDPFSKMHTSSKSLLAEDVCAVAFPAGAERNKCMQARKDLDPAGLPSL